MVNQQGFYSSKEKKIVLQSVTANTRQDGLDLLREAAAIPIRTHTTSLPLEHANIALQELKAGTIQGAAVLSVSS